METLHAGPISVIYDKGFLRRISYGETEILRMIYFALRDHNWNTIKSSIENENLTVDDSHFEINYDYFNVDGGVDVMEWKGKIEGKPDGTIVFEISGVVLEDFQKNRAGFCVLHPLNITDQECLITHPDSSRTTERFPERVLPHSPFKQIRSMAWSTSGAPFRLIFEGDIFETEDQRNYGDASFKTFCTPLDKPFPVELKKGQKIFQQVTFEPASALNIPKGKPAYATLRDTGERTVIPALGIGASTESGLLSPEAVMMIRALRFSHYRIEIYPGMENWVSQFSNDYENAYALGLPLEVALHLTENYGEEIESFILLCQQNKVKVKKVLLLQSDQLVTRQEVIALVPSLKQSLPKVSMGAGTNYNFNEINRNHFTADHLDFISFSIDPQEHAIDYLTIMENMEAHEFLINTARSIYGEGKEVHVSPLTLRKRFNPYATSASGLHIDDSLKADPRQKENLAALWSFGSVCHLARAGAAALTYYQTTGNQGIMSENGEPYPVYHTLKSLSSFQGKSARVLESSDPLSVKAIILDEKTLGIANLTTEERSVRMDQTEITMKPHEIRFEPLHRPQ